MNDQADRELYVIAYKPSGELDVRRVATTQAGIKALSRTELEVQGYESDAGKRCDFVAMLIDETFDDFLERAPSEFGDGEATPLSEEAFLAEVDASGVDVFY